MWCFLFLLISYISLVSNAILNPCEVLDKTKTDLSFVTVLFINLEYTPFVAPKVAKNQSIQDIFESLNNQHFHLFKFNYLPQVIETFMKCYGRDSGLQIESLSFEKQLSVMQKCNLKTRGINQALLRGKVIRVFESLEFLTTCGPHQLDPLLLSISSESTALVRQKIGLCHHHDCKLLKLFGFDAIPFTTESLFYEKLETIVDSFASLSSAFLNISDGIEPKYMYFSSVPTSYTPIWPSLVAVFVVLIFFVMGLILCCCGLFMFGLVEEDFQKRNEENEWLEANRRREEYLINAHEDPIEIPNLHNQDNSRSSESDMLPHTAKSHNSMVSSTSSTAVVTDRTQMSETEPLIRPNPKHN
ncbi:Recep_L_domain domain-containing protein [Caenorhabditis elegans]|uniref:Recep_L_domain domain-containing protein n=1 Tax=Caenorhabditis elegans TaxID=6239 RepID=Q18353_CAEEL|nr:Recep_L_domain domain-containing protein [Caenorhabditis elegans]CAA98111.3 Recep_L_domain domain-containing protein [Caenorhabditis elegans]|eukprot:NP_001256242.1 Uncharacterized protein CELE_C32C4.3 [Caenorhabditis elegans]